MAKLQASCPICGRDLRAGGDWRGAAADEKVEPLWRNIVCSEICYLQLSRGNTTAPETKQGTGEAAGPDGPQVDQVQAALIDETTGRVIPFTGRSRRSYHRPGRAHSLHLPAHHSAESIAPLIRLAESSGPDSSFTHMVMGSMLHSVGLYDSALEELNEALRIDPSSQTARLHKGYVLERKGRHTEAAEQFRLLMDQHADWAEAYVGLGISLYGLGEVEGAVNQFSLALEIDPRNICAMLNKAVAYNNQGLFYLAEKVVRQLLAVDPGSAEGRLCLGAVLLERGTLAEAEAEFRQVTELQERNADGHYYLGETRWRSGRRGPALTAFRRATELNPRDPDGHYKVGILLLEKGDAPGAARSLTRALELDEGDLEARFHLGMSLSMMGRLEEAHDHLEMVRQVTPDLPEVNLCLAFVFYKMGKQQQALQLFSRYKDEQQELVQRLLRLAGLKK
jgi:Flp pilus assembly protein TadD